MSDCISEFAKREQVVRQKPNEWLLLETPKYSFMDLLELKTSLNQLDNRQRAKYEHDRVNVKQVLTLFLNTGYSEEVFDAIMEQTKVIEKNRKAKDTLSKGKGRSIVKIELQDDASASAIQTELSPTKTTRDNLEECIKVLYQNECFFNLEVEDATGVGMNAKKKYYAPFLLCADILAVFSMLDARPFSADFLERKKENINLRLPKRAAYELYGYTPVGYEIGKQKYSAWIDRTKECSDLDIYIFSLNRMDKLFYASKICKLIEYRKLYTNQYEQYENRYDQILKVICNALDITYTMSSKIIEAIDMEVFKDIRFITKGLTCGIADFLYPFVIEFGWLISHYHISHIFKTEDGIDVFIFNLREIKERVVQIWEETKNLYSKQLYVNSGILYKDICRNPSWSATMEKFYCESDENEYYDFLKQQVLPSLYT